MSYYYLIGAITAVGLVGVISVYIAFKARIDLRLLDSTIEQLTNKINQLEHNRDMANEGLHEIRSATMGVSNRVKELSVQVLQLTEKTQELELLDPDTRLYTQASKMAISGASIEELMAECDLPRAEAELIFSVHKK